MATYLDNAGVTQILTKIKSLLAKKAEITAIPTKVSQLTNDRQYQTDDDVTASIGNRLGELTFKDTDDSTGYITNINQENGLVKFTRNSFYDSFAEQLDAATLAGKVMDLNRVKLMVNSAVKDITSFEYKVVDSLPSTTEGKKGTIYLIAHSGGTNQNSYDEYIFLPAEGSTAARYEKIGTTDIDLTPYAKKTEIPTNLNQLSNADTGFINAQTSAKHVATAIGKLDYSDTAEEGKYVSSVSETDGVIKVTRANLPAVGTADSPISNTTIENIFTQVFG